MIHLELTLTNVFSDRFFSIKNYHLPITKNKSLELEIYKTNDIISLVFNITHKKDHAGVQLLFGFLGFALSVNLYDNRHWDTTNNCWEEHDNTNR